MKYIIEKIKIGDIIFFKHFLFFRNNIPKKYFYWNFLPIFVLFKVLFLQEKIYCLYRRNEIVGSVSYCLGYASNLLIKKSFRKRGYGSKLIRHLQKNHKKFYCVSSFQNFPHYLKYDLKPLFVVFINNHSDLYKLYKK